jgi:hypothetical protein
LIPFILSFNEASVVVSGRPHEPQQYDNAA